MRPLIIQPNDDLSAPGDLHARVSGDELLLPTDFAQIFRHAGVRTAADLVSYLESFPSAAATLLNWKITDIFQATILLKKHLAEHGEVFPPRHDYHKLPAMGALDPDLLTDPPDDVPSRIRHN